ncbi:MAG: DUF3592 domain-containing protein [Alteraurantiacibacter sp.]
MRPNAIKRLLKGLAALTVLGLIVSLPLALIGYAGLTERDRRIEVLNTGRSATAIVTESSKLTTRSCAFTYQFQSNGQIHIGGEGGCPLVSDHPVGSAVIVRFDPKDPENSVAVGADLWPGWSIVPVLLGATLLLLGCFFLYLVIWDAFFAGKPSRSKQGQKSGKRQAHLK